jgi:cytochrome b pre-mRNA-processing protein 3
VAQARLPTFYQSLAVPDTLQGRFLVLSLHLFAVLHRLKGEGPEGLSLAQELSNRFSEDMETVLREIGVGDISIPKKMRGLAASGGALLQAYDEALASGEQALASAIAGAFPLKAGWLEGATRPIARYVMGMVRSLEAQPLAALRAGEVDFSGPMPGPAGR